MGTACDEGSARDARDAVRDGRASDRTPARPARPPAASRTRGAETPTSLHALRDRVANVCYSRGLSASSGEIARCASFLWLFFVAFWSGRLRWRQATTRRPNPTPRRLPTPHRRHLPRWATVPQSSTSTPKAICGPCGRGKPLDLQPGRSLDAGERPKCLDENGWAWTLALLKQYDPPNGKVGFGYMLQGGADPSNTDPFAMEPAHGMPLDHHAATCDDLQSRPATARLPSDIVGRSTPTAHGPG